MKKVKVMLLSLLVLAVVGGALAFKANTKFDQRYCTTNAVQNPANGQWTCPTPLQKACVLFQGVEIVTSASIIPNICTTTAPGSGNCANVTCPTTARLIDDGN